MGTRPERFCPRLSKPVVVECFGAYLAAPTCGRLTNNRRPCGRTPPVVPSIHRRARRMHTAGDAVRRMVPGNRVVVQYNRRVRGLDGNAAPVVLDRVVEKGRAGIVV